MTRPNLNRKLKTRDRTSLFTSSLLHWYRKSGRKLPWRRERDPYRILVSEVMLQQTQVSRVMAKYPIFLRRFPTLERLARAKKPDVIRAWQGMGYNNRILRLHQLAKTVQESYGGKLPRRVDQLTSLPGVGRYTAHAVACFAFGRQLPVVDTNVTRVLSRFFRNGIQPPSARRLIHRGDSVWKLAQQVLPKARASDWNQALMDLGATICTSRAPKCRDCPLRTNCPSAYRSPVQTDHVAKREPGRNGIPNRIYRGRIVEVLRNLEGRGSIHEQRLAKLTTADYRRRDEGWFTDILRGLERDGLISVKVNRFGKQVSLPEE